MCIVKRMKIRGRINMEDRTMCASYSKNCPLESEVQKTEANLSYGRASPLAEENEQLTMCRDCQRTR